jgi:ADP-ribosyl-[dinitrogen reductase] hydrolase
VISLLDRYKGCLLGLAVGDALGTTIEFKPRGTFEPINDMIGGGVFNLEAGQWTDDTSMALCLADSLIQKNKFDAFDQMQRYVKWWRYGYLSSTGRCFDIGNTVKQALIKFEKTKKPYSGSQDPMSAGNGSLMRLAAIPLFFFFEPNELIENAADSSKTTHGSAEAVDACRYYSSLIVGALAGLLKKELLGKSYQWVGQILGNIKNQPKIKEIASGAYKRKPSQKIKGTGYVIDCLEAALWAFHKTESFEQGVLLAANLGNDADTTAAVYGQLAGAYYGIQGIPQQWLKKLAYKDLIESYSARLYEGALKNALMQPRAKPLPGYKYSKADQSVLSKEMLKADALIGRLYFNIAQLLNTVQ